MKTFIETLRDGKCTVNAELPSTREEAIAILNAMPEEDCMKLLDKAVDAWWFHNAPKKETVGKGKDAMQVDKTVSYGSEAKPFSLADIAALCVKGRSSDGEPSKADCKAAKEWFQIRRIDWRKANPGMAPEEPKAQAAFKSIVEARAEANRAANYPALVWEWDATRDHLGNLAVMERAFRLYKADTK